MSTDLRATGAATSAPPPDDEPTNRAAAVRLAVIVAAVIALVSLTHGFDVLVVVLALVVMIMVHEAGHLIAAKWSGMKVTEYFLGFGPRILSFRRGETEYGVKAIPAGGYVRIVGMSTLEEIDPSDEARSYRQATFPRRLLVGVAGSAMHFVMAFLLLWGLAAFAGLPGQHPEIQGFTKFANATSPAKAAGLEVGDVVVSAGGEAVTGMDQFANYIHSHADTVLHLEVRRHGELIALDVRSRSSRELTIVSHGKVVSYLPRSSPAEGVIGVELGQPYVTVSPLVAVGHAATLVGTVTKASVVSMGQIFSPSGLRSFFHSVVTARSAHAAAASSSSTTSGQSSGQLISILGAIQIGAQAAQQNISELLAILAGVNIFIGLVNLFPMLPLDGGHVVIALYERLRSRRGRRYYADVRKLMPLAYLLLAVLMVLGLGALYANAVNPVHLPGG